MCSVFDHFNHFDYLIDSADFEYSKFPVYIDRKDDSIELNLNVAGFDKEELSLEVKKDLLIIKGESKKLNKKFTKQFKLNGYDDISADYKNGMLTILIKDKEDQKRVIEIGE